MVLFCRSGEEENIVHRAPSTAHTAQRTQQVAPSTASTAGGTQHSNHSMAPTQNVYTIIRNPGCKVEQQLVKAVQAAEQEPRYLTAREMQEAPPAFIYCTIQHL